MGAVAMKAMSGDNEESETAEDLDECAICHEGYKRITKKDFLPCAHFFHKDCIKFWLEENDSCPVCGTVLTANTPPSAATSPTAAASPAIATSPTAAACSAEATSPTDATSSAAANSPIESGFPSMANAVFDLMPPFVARHLNQHIQKAGDSIQQVQQKMQRAQQNMLLMQQRLQRFQQHMSN